MVELLLILVEEEVAEVDRRLTALGGVEVEVGRSQKVTVAEEADQNWKVVVEEVVVTDCLLMVAEELASHLPEAKAERCCGLVVEAVLLPVQDLAASSEAEVVVQTRCHGLAEEAELVLDLEVVAARTTYARH